MRKEEPSPIASKKNRPQLHIPIASHRLTNSP